MGYTHYASVHYGHEPPDAFGRTLRDTKRIIERAELDGISIAGPDGTGEPILREGILAFNGATPDEHGPFVLLGMVPHPDDYGWHWGRAWDGDGWHIEHCKTERHTYDAVVGAVLIRMAVHYGRAVRVRSDGADEWTAGPQRWRSWRQARELCEAVFGGALAPFTDVPLVDAEVA